MFRFFDGNKEVEIPTALEELTSDQYRFLLTLASIYAASHTMSENEMRECWLAHLCGLGPLVPSLFVRERRERYEEAMRMTDGFFRHGEDGRLVPDFDTPVNLLPEVEGSGTRLYHGPKDWLDGMTYGEFTRCLTLLEGVRNDAGEESARSNLEIYGEIARVMYRIPEEEEIPDILYFHSPTLFRNVMRQIYTGPIEINGKMIDFRIIFQSSGADRHRDDKTGWAGITFEVASSGVFGGLKEVEATDFWMVLLYLYRCKFEYLHSKQKGG